MDKIQDLGLPRVVKEINEFLKVEEGNFPMHINLDMDCADPKFVPGAGTKARGGFNFN